MRLRRGAGARAVALSLLAVLVTGCGEGGQGAREDARPPSEADAGSGTETSADAGSGSGSDAGKGSGAQAGAGSAGAPGGGSENLDFGTVFDSERKLRTALPEPNEMRGWTPARGSVGLIDEPSGDCGADWDCRAIARGKAQYEAFGETVDFEIVAFADRAAASDACRRQAARTAKYPKAEVPSHHVPAAHAYYRSGGGLMGLEQVSCLGTVVASVRSEGDGFNNPASVGKMGDILVAGILEAAAA